MKTIVLTKSASKELDALPEGDRVAVETALHQYAITGKGDIKALAGRQGFRMRVGSYRVIFAEDQTTILTVYVGRRSTTTYKLN